MAKKKKTIQIAPYGTQIEFTENSIKTDWNGGIEYICPIQDLLSVYTGKYLRQCFSEAIALSSKKHQLERLLNEHFNINGKIA